MGGDSENAGNTTKRQEHRAGNSGGGEMATSGSRGGEMATSGSGIVANVRRGKCLRGYP
jgi:hypothetical protein